MSWGSKIEERPEEIEANFFWLNHDDIDEDDDMDDDDKTDVDEVALVWDMSSRKIMGYGLFMRRWNIVIAVGKLPLEQTYVDIG